MEKLTNEEKELINHKRKLIYAQIPDNIIKTPFLRVSVDNALITLLKNNSIGFINEMYGRFLRTNEFMYDPTQRIYVPFSSKLFGIERNYNEWLSCKDIDDFQNHVYLYARFLERIFEYHIIGRKPELEIQNYFRYDTELIDNKRVYDILLFINEMETKCNNKEATELTEFLLTYIFINDDILLNEDKWKSVIEEYYNDPNKYWDYLSMNKKSGIPKEVLPIFESHKKIII